jgi:hypothetical protein
MSVSSISTSTTNTPKDDESGEYIDELDETNNIKINDELWKDIPLPEMGNYQAHPDGLIRNKKTNRIFQNECKKHKYISVKLVGKMHALHRLIAITFLDNTNNLPYVNHKDRNSRNNRSDNLEWINASDNVLHALATGEPVINKKPNSSKVLVTFRNGDLKVFNSIKDASAILNVSAESISHCLGGDGHYTGIRSLENKKDNWLWKIERIIEAQTPTNPLTGSGPEVRKDITLPGFFGYIATSNGQVINKKTGKSVGKSDGRYLRVRSLILPENNSVLSSSIALHKLIAHTFIPNPEHKEFVNHKNGITTDNNVENLEWVTQSENMIHARETGLVNAETDKARSEKCYVTVHKLELNGTIIESFNSIKKIKDKFLPIISTICSDYRINKNKITIFEGFGYCYVSDYKEPRINKSFSNLFPELVNRISEVDFNILRPFVIRTTRPIWQINIDGTRIKLWDSMADAQTGLNINMSNIATSIKTNGERLAGGGYSWTTATYDEIANPERPYQKIIPAIVKKALGIPLDNTTLQIRPEITAILRENVSSDGQFTIKTRPIKQLDMDDNLIRIWSSPTKARNDLSIGRNLIELCLVGRMKQTHGFKWKTLELDEICF